MGRRWRPVLLSLAVLAWLAPLAPALPAAAGATTVLPQGSATSGQSPPVLDAVSSRQYRLAGSDGRTWLPIDPAKLMLTIPAHTDVLVTGTADLWTATPGVNQDLGLLASGPEFFPGTQLYSWKESGGGNGFSPHATTVEALIPNPVQYSATLTLVWKANRPFRGSGIFAGAGTGPRFSPTRLTATVVPPRLFHVDMGAAGSQILPYTQAATSTTQYRLVGDRGNTWNDMTSLERPYVPSLDGTAVISANADLWTATRGVAPDIGIFVNAILQDWKEGGGVATFSPDPAVVMAVVPMHANTSYDIRVRWKASRYIPRSRIYVGAGPGPDFSPSALFVNYFVSSSSLSAAVSTRQYRLSRSDGRSWKDIDSSRLAVPFVGHAACMATIAGTANLSTAGHGLNADLGIAVRSADGGVSPYQLEWREGAGPGGPFSVAPLFAEVSIPMHEGVHYVARLQWKTNRRAAGSAVLAGAGPAGGASSSTRLTVSMACPGPTGLAMQPSRSVVPAGTPVALSIQIVDAGGEPSAVPDDVTVELSSSSAQGRFQSSYSSSVTTAFIPVGGTGTSDLQYVDTQPGPVTITASTPGLLPATLTLTIT